MIKQMAKSHPGQNSFISYAGEGISSPDIYFSQIAQEVHLDSFIRVL